MSTDEEATKSFRQREEAVRALSAETARQMHETAKRKGCDCTPTATVSCDYTPEVLSASIKHEKTCTLRYGKDYKPSYWDSWYVIQGGLDDE